MFTFKKLFCAAALIGVLASVNSHALIGIGVHYGLDNTLSMKNTDGMGDRVGFDSSLALDIGGTNPLKGQNVPVFITRSNFHSDFSFGGKIFVDIFPVIDAIELSANFGLWEYDGALQYPTGLKDPSAAGIANEVSNPSDANFNYATMPLTLNSVGLGYWGLSHTPYAKLNIDATVRKYLLKFPPIIDLFKIYGGAGVTVNFATPMLSSHLVKDAISESSNGSFDFTTIGSSLFNNTDVMQRVVNKIIYGLTEPSYAALIDVGVSFKAPIIPIGLYIDGKFMIPFGSIDKYVDVGGTGILLNAGILLSI